MRSFGSVDTPLQHSLAVVFRVSPVKGATVHVQLFSEKFGRMNCLCTPKHAPVVPFCLIEAAFCVQRPASSIREVAILDSFLEIRKGEQYVKSAWWMREIVDVCLPKEAPAQNIWDSLLFFLTHVHSFEDWKMPPLLLALLLFEHEGVSPKVLMENPMLSSEAREVIRRILDTTDNSVNTMQVPQDLFDAAMECVGIKRCAKGGT